MDKELKDKLKMEWGKSKLVNRTQPADSSTGWDFTDIYTYKDEIADWFTSKLETILEERKVDFICTVVGCKGWSQEHTHKIEWQQATVVSKKVIEEIRQSERESIIGEIEKLVPYDENAEQEDSGAYEYFGRKELKGQIIHLIRERK